MASRSVAIPQRVYPTGMTIALGGVMMFFAALISAWVVHKGFALPASEVPVKLPRLLLEANAVILLASSATIEIARRKIAAVDDEHDGFRFWWLVSIGLGVAFLAGQATVWARLWAEGVFIASNPESSFFYLFTAAHAIHLIGGIAGLVLIAFRPLRRMAFGTAVKVGAMYWHFLTAVWLVILALMLGGIR